MYNELDVLLLADVFENFRDEGLKQYDLDPAHYYTAPGLGWDASLKVTDVKLELLSDTDMLLMVGWGIRGGVSMVSNRYAKANNKYIGDKYDPSIPSKSIIDFDANNLYRWAMSKPLPTHGFEWMEPCQLGSWKKVPCILEVDFEYPIELHNLHDDYPLAPESIEMGGVKKLIPNLWDKERYVVHHVLLKLYLCLGFKI